MANIDESDLVFQLIVAAQKLTKEVEYLKAKR